MPKDCPDTALLKRLVAGGLSPEREQLLSEHLDQCEKCRDRLEHVAAGDRTLNDVARNLKGSRELTDSMKRVIEKCTSDPLIMTVGSVSERNEEPTEGQIAERRQHRNQTRSLSQIPDVKAVTLAPGIRLGTYELVEEIGRGGVGVVWKARDLQFDRFVAIKILNSQVLPDETARQRFLREARAVGAVNHRNVVKMYGVEESPVPYLVMELVDGPSLRTHLARKGPLDLPTILRIGLQIANGLEASHACGVTHRDIKPANIVLDIPTGRVKLTDFGLAHIEGDIRLTLVGFVSGTPSYMSPEQAMGDTIDHRSDLFSLGSVLYAMSTGQSPFDDDRTFAGQRTFAALERVRIADPAPAQSINPKVPSSLSDLIRWLHSREPGNRPSSAAEVARILKQQLDQLKQTTPSAAPVEDSQRFQINDLVLSPTPTAPCPELPNPPAVRTTRRDIVIAAAELVSLTLLVFLNQYFQNH